MFVELWVVEQPVSKVMPCVFDQEANIYLGKDDVPELG